ncbi:hypothetical protein [Paenibacillus sp. FSL R10-2788]|jgi:hypothetical protein|uniref:hypothetical protein n=1 Tax=Paenibacillus sp. FSL R10-2788 TaxID=2954694 RepID=UPI0030F7D8C6
MKYGLLENGVDSLKSAYTSIDKISYLHEGIEHNIKDAILSLNHAIEILMKLILKGEREYLIFSDIGKYMNAKKQMIIQGKPTVFDVGHDLKTVSLLESVKRLQLLCDIELPKVFIAGIDNFNVTRNKLMHYELELSEAEVNETTRDLKGLYEEAVNFFGTYIDNIAELLEAARFESTDSDYAEAMAEWYQDMAYDEYVEQQLEREND